ncbi:hypothetical protein GGR56DRAFT_660605 [Xylariaceae sp. FL0804]|nr:hypothetical protein GGR56DRAFT_660605 [Xylariaceae sp. FL0804]
MPLISLPLELILRIVREIIPEDFENVRLTCRTLNAAADMFLEEYLRRRRRFRHIALPDDPAVEVPPDAGPEASAGDGGGDGDGDGNRDATTRATSIRSMNELLRCIARDPTVARYIQTANFKGPNEGDDWRFGRLQLGIDDDPVRELVRESSHLREAGVDPDAWLSCMTSVDGQGYVQIFLLTLLPNVTTLTPSHSWDDWLQDRDAGDGGDDRNPDLPKRRVMEAIVRAANSPASDASLSKLRTIRAWAGSGYDQRGLLNSCAHFLAIDSLRSLHAGSVIGLEDGYTGTGFEPLYDRFSPNLETIELFASLIGRVSLRRLLSRTPNLKHFRFAHQTKWHGCGWNWDAGAAVAIIQECVGDSLESLQICLMDNAIDNGGTTLTDMSGFRSLKTFEINFDLLCGPAYDKDAVREPVEFEGDDDEEPPFGDPTMVRLVDLLPPSIERVGIYNFALNMYGEPPETTRVASLEVARRLFDGLTIGHCDRLPHLQEVRLEPNCYVEHHDLVRATLDEVSKSGCTLSSPKSENSWPDFALSFHDRFGVWIY